MVATFPAPLILALLLNELRGERFKKIVQTTSYIPHFVSWVTVAGLFYLFLTVDATGLVNNIRQFFDPGAERISFMQDAHNFLPVLVISEIWKETGWGTILYLAALTTIDPQQYEAAQVDGASRFQRLRYITLPGLVPTMCILLIFSLSGLLATNFDQVFNLQNKMIRLDTDTIGVYTYYQGLVSGQYSYSAAVGLFQGLVSFILIMATNATTKRLSNVGII
nr:ABC transporter permease subunit [Paenibacillus artemisiicola]